MSERIGVYVCECGPNIKDALRFNEVVSYAGGLDNVVFAKPFKLMCSAEGKELIAKDIARHKLSRIVIAACSPREHEITFRKVLEGAGMNPYFLQIANIREHCSWVIKDPAAATEQAKRTIKAAVKRVVYNEALFSKEIDLQADVLVVGAGIAGITAALTLAQKKRKVYLAEKLPCIGGKVGRFAEVFPKLECASCMIGPKLDEVLRNENISLLTYSEIKEVTGFYGNFNVKINKKARFINAETCIGCGACVKVCPVKVKNEYNEGLDERKAVYIPYPGSLPNLAVIDRQHCIRFKKQECGACQSVCPFGAVNYADADQIIELKVGAVVLATGYDLFNAASLPQYGYGKIDNVYTSLEIERLLNTTGPSAGKVLLKNGESPRKIAIIHCVGSRNKKYLPHCSSVCCLSSLKFARLIKKQLPDVSIVGIYSDLCLPGKDSQAFFESAREEKSMEFMRVNLTDALEIKDRNGKICIKHTALAGPAQELESFDMVILALGMQGNKDSEELIKIFDVNKDNSNFLVEENALLEPVSTVTKGIFIAGCAAGPADISVSAAQGMACAGKILSRLEPGEKLKLDPCVAEVNADLCSGCKSCIGLCAYKAISYDEGKKRAKVNEVLCRGCGICVSACPSAAIIAKHFTDKQILEEIKGYCDK